MSNVNDQHLDEQSPLHIIKQIGALSQDAVCLYDVAAAAFIYANDRFFNLLEISEKRITALGLKEIDQALNDDWNAIDKHISDLLNSGKIQNIEFRLKLESGPKYISVDAYHIREMNKIIAIVKDTTTAKRHMDYIVEFGARKDALLDMVAHNLSGPLNMTTNLLNAIDHLTKNQRFNEIDNLNRLIRESTQHCIELINSFLDQEHSESERVLTKRNLFDANKKAAIVVERMKQFNGDKTISVISSSEEIMVRADDVKFFQIVHNLLSNAVKFTPPHGNILVELKEDEFTFELRVTDDGIGIPSPLQQHLFERNTPASRPGLKGEQSIGMGLYIVKKLVDMMNGKISFHSTEQKGTSVVIRWPKK